MFFVFYIFCPQFVLVLFCFSVFCFFQQMKFALHTYIIELFLDFCRFGNEMITYMHLSCLFLFSFVFVLNFTTVPCSLTWTLSVRFPLLRLFYFIYFLFFFFYFIILFLCKYVQIFELGIGSASYVSRSIHMWLCIGTARFVCHRL